MVKVFATQNVNVKRQQERVRASLAAAAVVVNYHQGDQIWLKIAILRENKTVLDYCLGVYIVFGKIMNQLCQRFAI